MKAARLLVQTVVFLAFATYLLALVSGKDVCISNMLETGSEPLVPDQDEPVQVRQSPLESLRESLREAASDTGKKSRPRPGR